MRFIVLAIFSLLVIGCDFLPPTHSYDYTTTEEEILSSIGNAMSRQSIEEILGRPNYIRDGDGFTVVAYHFDGPPSHYRGDFTAGINIVYMDGKSHKVSVSYGQK